MSLSREAGTILVWDGEPTLGRYDRLGQREVRQRAPADLLLADLADDGRTVAAVGKKGQVWLLNGDLVPLWERSVPRRPVALALDHLGLRLAVADESGGLHLFDRNGNTRWHETTARPLSHLIFVPEVGTLVGTAGFGLVCTYDDSGRCVWRDGLVAHVGDLAVTGDGAQIVLACFTGGLCRYPLDRPKRELLDQVGACRLVGMSYTGERLVTADLEKTLSLRDKSGAARSALALPASPVALRVEALGDSVVCALVNGQLVRVPLLSAFSPA
jgi:hypothetical protein